MREVGPRRVGDAREIDAVMLEEGAILGGEDRLHHQRREFVVRQFDTALARVGMDRLAVDAAHIGGQRGFIGARSEEHTSELQSLMRISYAVFCLKTKNNQKYEYIRTQ